MDFDNRIRLPEGYHLSGGIKETYIIEKYVNAGANSIVYQAWYRDSLRPEKIHTVLIKELYPYDPNGGIIREADMGLTVRPGAEVFFEKHRESFLFGNDIHLMLANEGRGGIAENLDSFEQNHTLYTVLNIRAGQVLDEVMKQKKEFFSLTTAARFIHNLLRILQRFHEHGLLHLDISPDNIFLLETAGQEETADVLLLDFNSVYSVEDPSEGINAYYSGKNGYMAPEVRLHQREELGAWTDIYSVTAVFYYILTEGMAPQDLELAREEDLISPYSRILLHEKEVSAQLVNEILKKGLRMLPQDRYRCVGEMLEDVQKLENILNGTLRIPYGGSAWPEADAGKQKKHWKRRLAAGLAVAAVVAAVGGAYYAGRQYMPPGENTELDLTEYPLETDERVVLTEQNARYPLADNVMRIQVSAASAVRVLLKDYTHERNLEDAFSSYAIFLIYAGENDKRGWQFGDMTYDFFYTEDNSLHMELPLQDTNDFNLDYIGVIFQNHNYDESNLILDINRCTLVDGEGNAHEMTELLGSHLLYFDEEYWQQNLITEQNQQYVKTFEDIRGGKLIVDADAGFLDPVLDVEFSSDNPRVATVDERGRITGVRQGTATITVSVTDRNTGEERQTQMLVYVTSKL